MFNKAKATPEYVLINDEACVKVGKKKTSSFAKFMKIVLVVLIVSSFTTIGLSLSNGAPTSPGYNAPAAPTAAQAQAAAQAQDAKKPNYSTDVRCMAALSIARDISEYEDRALFLQLTDVQNSFYLKYENPISTAHVNAQKVLIKGRMTKNINYLTAVVAQCIS